VTSLSDVGNAPGTGPTEVLGRAAAPLSLVMRQGRDRVVSDAA
jgi:hypothetical protein